MNQNTSVASDATPPRRGTPRRLPGGAPLQISLDLEGREPLYRQIYRALREAVLAGRLLPGVRLPSTRTLASDLSVSRNTVLAAYDQLLAEGYLDGRIGSGTRVSGVARGAHGPARVAGARQPAGAPATPGSSAPVSPGRERGNSGPSRRGEMVAGLPLKLSLMEGGSRAFRPGVPALDEFPVRTWRRLLSRRWQRAGSAMLDYGDPAGFAPLRQAIASYLGAARGVRCEPEQVIVVSGSQQGLDLAGRVLLDPGDSVWLEDPGYYGARGAFVGAGARVVPVPVDGEGMSVEAGRAMAPEARLAYVTPSHQFPLGVTMSLARRLALLEWARQAGAWLLEDDYDSEYRYATRPISALQGIDPAGRVIYSGTFSKVLFPALRLGYLVVPGAMVDAFIAARLFADTHSPTVDQAVLADFIADGHFERHIRRTRALYRERQQVLVTAASRELAPALTIGAAQAGMHLLGWLPPGADDRAVSRAAASRGVDVIPLSAFAIETPRRGGLLFGYAHLHPREITDAVTRLRPALSSTSAARPAGAGDAKSASAGIDSIVDQVPAPI